MQIFFYNSTRKIFFRKKKEKLFVQRLEDFDEILSLYKLGVYRSRS